MTDILKFWLFITVESILAIFVVFLIIALWKEHKREMKEAGED
jgi:hypothetical protein